MSGSALDLVFGVTAAAPLIGNMTPFAGLEIDDAIVAAPAPGTSRVRGTLRDPAPKRRHEQCGAQHVRYKTRKYQQDSTEYGTDAGRLEPDRPNPVMCEGGTHALE